MKPETERGMDHLVQRIGELAAEVRTLADIAEKQYAIEVQDLLKAQVRDPVCIERCLDGMLDFCFHDGVLILYKKLCRYYYDIDPAAAAEYVYAYRDMWDEQDQS